MVMVRMMTAMVEAREVAKLCTFERDQFCIHLVNCTEMNSMVDMVNVGNDVLLVLEQQLK